MESVSCDQINDKAEFEIHMKSSPPTDTQTTLDQEIEAQIEEEKEIGFLYDESVAGIETSIVDNILPVTEDEAPDQEINSHFLSDDDENNQSQSEDEYGPELSMTDDSSTNDEDIGQSESSRKSEKNDNNTSLSVHIEDDEINELDDDIKRRKRVRSHVTLPRGEPSKIESQAEGHRTDDKNKVEGTKNGSSMTDSEINGSNSVEKAEPGTTKQNDRKPERKNEKPRRGDKIDESKHTSSRRERRGESSKSESRDSAEKDGYNLWVGGLSSVVKPKDLKSLFGKYGKVLGSKVVSKTKAPGASNYGFVTVKTSECARKCIKYLHKESFHGRRIFVEKAKSTSEMSAQRNGKQIKSTVIKSTAETKTDKDAHILQNSQNEGQFKSSDKKNKPLVDNDDTNGDRLQALYRNVQKTSELALSSNVLPKNAVEDSVGSDKMQADKAAKKPKPVITLEREILSLDEIKEKRERERKRRFKWIEERKKIQELEKVRQLQEEIERKQQEESMRLEQERLCLRKEKESVLELLQERERLRIERELLEREKQELALTEQIKEKNERHFLKEEHTRPLDMLRLEDEHRGSKRLLYADADEDLLWAAKRPALDLQYLAGGSATLSDPNRFHEFDPRSAVYASRLYNAEPVPYQHQLDRFEGRLGKAHTEVNLTNRYEHNGGRGGHGDRTVISGSIDKVAKHPHRTSHNSPVTRETSNSHRVSSTNHRESFSESNKDHHQSLCLPCSHNKLNKAEHSFMGSPSSAFSTQESVHQKSQLDHCNTTPYIEEYQSEACSCNYRYSTELSSQSSTYLRTVIQTAKILIGGEFRSHDNMSRSNDTSSDWFR